MMEKNAASSFGKKVLIQKSITETKFGFLRDFRYLHGALIHHADNLVKYASFRTNLYDFG